MSAAAERVRAALAAMEELSGSAGGRGGGAPAVAEAVAEAYDAAAEEADNAADDAACARTTRRARLVTWLGLLGLTVHWAVFARLTYWRAPARTAAGAAAQKTFTCTFTHACHARARAILSLPLARALTRARAARAARRRACLVCAQGAVLGRDGARGVPGQPSVGCDRLHLLHGTQNTHGPFFCARACAWHRRLRAFMGPPACASLCRC
jgi:hypothetical protein